MYHSFVCSSALHTQGKKNRERWKKEPQNLIINLASDESYSKNLEKCIIHFGVQVLCTPKPRNYGEWWNKKPKIFIITFGCGESDSQTLMKCIIHLDVQVLCAPKPKSMQSGETNPLKFYEYVWEWWKWLPNFKKIYQSFVCASALYT